MRRLFPSSSTSSISCTGCERPCAIFFRRSRLSPKVKIAKSFPAPTRQPRKRAGTHDPDPKRGSLSLPSGRDVAADRNQLSGFSPAEQPEPCGTRRILARLRTHSRALHRRLRRWRCLRRRSVSLLYHDVSAWRLATSHFQHVDTVAVRTHRRGSPGPRPVSCVLSCMRACRFDCACRLQSDLDCTGIGRLRRDRRRAGLLFATVPDGAGRRGGSDHFHPTVL